MTHQRSASRWLAAPAEAISLSSIQPLSLLLRSLSHVTDRSATLLQGTSIFLDGCDRHLILPPEAAAQFHSETRPLFPFRPFQLSTYRPRLPKFAVCGHSNGVPRHFIPSAEHESSEQRTTCGTFMNEAGPGHIPSV